MSIDASTCARCGRAIPRGALFCPACGLVTPTDLIHESEVLPPAQEDPRESSLRNALQSALGPGYQVGKLLGQGGFGVVFQARDLRLQRDLAIKTLRRELLYTEGFAQRFELEAQALAKLNHPNIVPVFSIGESQGLIYIVMPFVKGMTLGGYLRSHPKLDVEEVIRILRGIGGALSAAHAAGLVHRDIKPENIMLEGEELRPLLMDFGIAKAVGATSAGQPGLTSTGMVMGTPLYMSPEQATADASIDSRADIYSLGVLSFELVTGRVPFGGDSTHAVVLQHMMTPPPDPRSLRPEVPDALASTIQRAMAKRPEDRFQTVAEFLAALGDAVVAPLRRATGAHRWGRLTRAGLLFASALPALWGWRLARRPTDRLTVSGELRVQELRVRLDHLQPLWQQAIPLRTLSVAGLEEASLPTTQGRPAVRLTEPIVTLSAVDADSARGSLSLDPTPMPAGTLVSILPGASDPHALGMSLGDSIPSLGVSADGQVQLQSGANPAETLFFSLDRLRLRPAAGTLEVEALPVPGQSDLLSGLTVSGIGLNRVDRFRDEEQNADHQASNVLGGVLRFPGMKREPRTLAQGAALTLDEFSGAVRDIRIDSAGVAFSFEGQVHDLAPEFGGMPGMLEIWWAAQPLGLALGSLAYVGWLGLIMTYRRGRS